MASALSLNIASHNRHGLAQGASLLYDLCKTSDIVLMQEHWLPPFSLDSLYNFSDTMLCYASSAMEEAITAGVLRGRPFGGVAIFC